VSEDRAKLSPAALAAADALCDMLDMLDRVCDGQPPIELPKGSDNQQETHQ
jgi:hypothetical protein